MPPAVCILTLVFLAASSGHAATIHVPRDQPTAGASPSLYTATELPPLPGYGNAQARAINNLGVAAGTSHDSEKIGPVTLWTGVQVVDLGRPSACGGTFPWAINDAGKIVGRCDETANANGFAWRWEGGSFQILPGTVVSQVFSIVATDVNEAGDVCGWEMLDQDGWALAWDAAGAPEPLTPPGTAVRRARAIHITESGQIVGYYSNWDGEAYLFLWEDGVLTEITPDTDPPIAPGWNFDDANDSLTMIGWSGASPSEGFVLSGGEVIPLETLPGHTKTLPMAINEPGDIVGRSYTAFPESRATIWRPDGGVYDLNDLIVEPLDFVLEYAADINDQGEIVGWGREAPFAEDRAFLLQPVPPVSAPHPDAVTSGPDTRSARPNPFGPGLAQATRLSFDLQRTEYVTVDVIDVTGRRHRLLHRGVLASGSHTIEWNGRDASGRWLPAGAYWLRVRGDNANEATKVVIRR